MPGLPESGEPVGMEDGAREADLLGDELVSREDTVMGDEEGIGGSSGPDEEDDDPAVKPGLTTSPGPSPAFLV